MILHRLSSAALSLSCLIAYALAPACLAQRGHGGSMSPKPTSNQPYTIPVTVRRVVLDVVVTDASHNAVEGLTAKDFSILEDNKPGNQILRGVSLHSAVGVHC